MRIRTKLVFLLGGAVLATMGLATWLRLALTRRQLDAEANQRAHEVAKDLARALEALPATADSTQFADVVNSAINQHATLLSIELRWLEGEQQSHLVASRGQKAVITHRRGSPNPRVLEPLSVSRSSKVARDRIVVVNVNVDPEGPLYGILSTRTTLESVDRLIKTQEAVAIEVMAWATLLLIVVIGVIVQRVIVRPLGRLSDGMRRVESGDLSSRLPEPESRDELGRLQHGFNRMVEGLDGANAEIRAFNHRLAQEVADATRDLQVKNTTLGHLNRLLVDTRRELGDKERLAALGQLAAQLAHEIGTPLGSVSGHLQLALSARDCPQALRDRLGVAIREVERVGKIVRDYLDSTRPAQPTLLPARLDRIVDEAVELARSAKAAERPTNVLVERRIESAVETVHTDPGLVRQILVNLVTNAFDAVGEEGQVTVEGRAVGRELYLSVQDSGAGIDSADLARIFEPFYTTKGRGKGTGLGLAICKELAVALKGRITVDSAPGKGSVFVLALPIAGAAPEDSEGRRSAA